MTKPILVAIGDIAEVYDGPHATPKKTSEGPIYLGIDAITDDGHLIPNAFAHLSESDYPKWTKRVMPQEDDIVFSYEATLGRYAIIPKGFRGALGRRLGIVRVDKSKVNPLWLYYYFLSPAWGIFIENHTYRGSTVNRISVEDYPTYKIPLPSLEKQNQAVSILAAMDRKIASNKKLMSELEAAARLIYDYWFTQFDFPDENGRPFRSSGGKMVWSDELKRDIPDGWKAGSLCDIACYSETGIECRELNQDTYISVDSMIPNFGGIAQSEYTPSSGQCRRFEAGDVLLGNIRPYFKKVHRAAFVGGCSPDVLVLHAISNASCFVYMTLACDTFINYDVAGSKGTKMPRGDKEHIMRYPLAIPPRRLLSAYEELVSSSLACKAKLSEENAELGSLRDWLLPMLMNGQATIGE